MESGRLSPLLLVWLVLGIALGTIAVFQYRSRQHAALAVLEARRQAEESQKAATIRAPESVEAPAISPEPLVRADARTPTQRTDVDAKELEIQVLDPSNAPVADAKILLFRGVEVLSHDATDAKGLAKFAALVGTGSYVIAVVGWEPVLGELELSAGRRTVTLAEAAVVAGTVLVDGLAPATPVELSWIPNDRSRPINALPDAIIHELRFERGNLTVTVVDTNVDGSFMFRGLAANSAGSIRWTGPYFTDVAATGFAGQSLAVSAPRSNLVIRLIAGLELRLRVVDVSGAGIPDAAVSLKFGSSTMTTTADPEGRLVHSYSRGSFEKISVTVASVAGGGAKQYEFVPPPGLRGVWDLGDLATSGTRQISVLVQGIEGQPVADVTVTPLPAQRALTTYHTDADGRTTITIGAEDNEIALGAFGYTSARVAVPPGASEVKATLSRACLLEFEIPRFSGDIELLALELIGPTPLFAIEAGLESLSKTSSGEGANSTQGPKTTSFQPAPDKSGRWQIAGLTPNQSLHATLKGGGKNLSEVEIAPLAPGERRRIELRLDDVGKSLLVRVLSPDGEPQTDATVYVSAASENNSRYRGIRTNAQGEVRLKSLYGDRCILFARARGFAAKSITLQPIPTGMIDMVMELPRTVEVELTGRDGSLFLERAQVVVRGGGPFGSGIAPSSGPGRYRLVGLPSAEVLLSVSGSFGRLSQLLDPSVPFVRIVVGEPGSISAVMRITKEQSRSGWSVAIALSGNAHDLTRDDLNFNDEGEANKKFEGLAPGAYDVWLEASSGDAASGWSRVGQPSPIVIDAEHTSVSVELHPPS